MEVASRPPIFVVGCQRSGTTMLRLILDSHPNISCGPETRFLEGLARTTNDEWRRLSQYGFEKDYWHQHIAAFFDGIMSDYARSKGKTRWADKTPRYALSLDFLTQVFPDCQVIHVLRDGRDVVLSHRKRFGYAASVKATKKWPHYVATARASAALLPETRYREVKYEDMVRAPEETLRPLFEWLGEPWDPAVLAYDDKPHDVPERYHRLASDRRAADGAAAAAVYQSRVGAHRRELGPELRLLMWLFGRRTLRELGYR